MSLFSFIDAPNFEFPMPTTFVEGPMLTLKQFVQSNTYKVRLTCPGIDAVTAYLISPILITTQSEWQAVGEQPFAGRGMDAAVQNLAGGMTLTNAMFSLQSWQGSQPISISVTVGFVGITDAYKDVWVPITNLLMYPLPEKAGGGGMIQGPVRFNRAGDLATGVTGSDFLGGSEMCTITTANMKIPDLLPCNATPEYNQVMTKDHSGGGASYPISGQVNISFQTAKMMTRDEVKQWFIW